MARFSIVAQYPWGARIRKTALDSSVRALFSYRLHVFKAKPRFRVPHLGLLRRVVVICCRHMNPTTLGEKACSYPSPMIIDLTLYLPSIQHLQSAREKGGPSDRNAI